MKKLITLLFAIILLSTSYAFSEEKKKFFKPWCSNKNSSASKTLNIPKSKTTVKKKEKFFKPWGPNKNSKKNNSKTAQKREIFKQSTSDNRAQNISVYTGTFDIIDKEGDDQTNLFGIEHKNNDLFRNTWIGRFSPTTGAIFTGKSSIYLYTGVEADYNLGPVSISPSFAPGYYEAGNGKNLGSALEFKSELKVGVDIFKNTNIGYSYSHISNNDWGSVNPGVDNQSITFSKNF